MGQSILERAEAFMWKNARLLERRLFEFHFMDGSPSAVVDALRPYQNADGGFGNALEPDIRCPDSQPVPVQHALKILSTVGFDGAMVEDACDYLLTITTSEGGVPWLLPSALEYPRAPWWTTTTRTCPGCIRCGTTPGWTRLRSSSTTRFCPGTTVF